MERTPKIVIEHLNFTYDDGTESLVNQLSQNDYFVIDFVPSAIMLRLGKAKARLDRITLPDADMSKLESGN
jgi:hypothetical protein